MAGYNVHYGIQFGNYDSVIDVGNITLKDESENIVGSDASNDNFAIHL